MSDIYFKDEFDGTDGDSPDSGWTEAAAGLQISKKALAAGGHSFTPSSPDSLVLARAAASAGHTRIGRDYQIGAEVILKSDSAGGETKGRLLIRGNASATTGYGVELKAGDTDTDEDVITLSIIKMDSGDTTLTSADVSDEVHKSGTGADDWQNMIQRVGVEVYDDDGAIVIRAFLNDEARPRLSYTDRSYPLWADGGYIGFVFIEDTDAVALASFRCRGFTSDEDSLGYVVPREWTFGKLKEATRATALRDSSSSMSDSYWGRLVNAAHAELHLRLGSLAWWLEELYQFKSRASQAIYELPNTVATVDSTVLDVTSGEVLPIENEASFQASGAGTETSALPQVFRLSGMGQSGGRVLRAYGTPTGERTYQVRVWHRPSTMVNDDDVPRLPDMYCEGLVDGAVARYSGHDMDRSRVRYAESRWERFIRTTRHDLARSQARAERSSNEPSRYLMGAHRTIFHEARYGVN